MKIECQICEKIIEKRDDQLLALCRAKRIEVCSIECFNDWEADFFSQEDEVVDETQSDLYGDRGED